MEDIEHIISLLHFLFHEGRNEGQQSDSKVNHKQLESYKTISNKLPYNLHQQWRTVKG